MDAFINEDVERALIGLTMQDNICATQVAAAPEKLFCVPEMRACKRAVERIIKKGKTVDIMTLDNEVKCDFDDTQLVMNCVNDGVSPAQCGQYIAILEQCAKRRELRTLSERIMQNVSNPGVSVEDLVSQCAAVATKAVGESDNITMKEAMTVLIDSFDKPDTLTSGVADVDRLIGGFRPGQLIYLGARPGIGKSALAMYMAKYAAEHGNGVLVVTLEMAETEIAARVLSNEANFDLQTMLSGKMELDDYLKIAPSYQPVSELPILINERARTPLLVRRAALKAKQKLNGNLKLIVVDYIQLMNTDGNKTGSRNEEVSTISRELKLLATDLAVPVLCLTQFNRLSTGTNKGQRYEEEPDMAQARDSGAIEQDANVFMTLHEPGDPAERGIPQGTREWNAYYGCMANGCQWMTLRIQKNRNGRTGLIDLAFKKPVMKFSCIALTGKTPEKKPEDKTKPEDAKNAKTD